MKKLRDRIAAFTPEQQRAFEEAQPESRRAMPLAFIRTALGKSQAALAELLGCKQPAVSRVESRNDVLLSTLWTFVKAMGANASIRVDHPAGRFVITAEEIAETGFSKTPRWAFSAAPAERTSVQFGEVPAWTGISTRNYQRMRVRKVEQQPELAAN